MMHHFNPERALELIERERITRLGGVPSMVMQVLDSPIPKTRHLLGALGLLRRRPMPPRSRPSNQRALPDGRPQPATAHDLDRDGHETGPDYVAKPDRRWAPPCPSPTSPWSRRDYDGAEPDLTDPRGPT